MLITVHRHASFMHPFTEYEKYNCAPKFNLLIINAMFPLIYAFEKLPTRSSVIIQSWLIWGPLKRNFKEIRLRGFLYQGTIIRKNQPGVSEKVVSISRVLTVLNSKEQGDTKAESYTHSEV